jgi:hypothetical protein
MIKKSHFRIDFDEGCRECTFDLDLESDKLTEKQKRLFALMEKTIDVPVKCVVCQLRTCVALNGEFSSNRELFKKWGWVEIQVPIDES